jgi:peptide/nickel transport system substrate-binding protein
MEWVRTTKYKGSIGSIPCLAALLFFSSSTACSRTTAPASAQQSEQSPVTLTVGYPHITGIDPSLGLLAAARLVSLEGLVSLSREGRPQPRLAERWTPSADGLSWSIRLRPNAVFHDGTPANAETIKQSLQRSMVAPDRDISPGLSDIASIETPSQYELLIRLKNRSTFVLENLTVPITKPRPGQEPIGTGPFMMVSNNDNQIVMNSVRNYYRGKSRIDRIVFRAYPTVRTAWAAMLRGDIDFLYEVAPEAVQFMQGETSVKSFSFLRSYTLGVILNSRRSALADPRVRRALNYAIDRNEIVEQALKGHGIPASGSAWPQHWAFDSAVPPFSYDAARAGALLDSAGLKKIDEQTGKAPAVLRFTCIFPESFALWERLGLLVQRNLAQVGVDMQLETLPVAEFNNRISTRDFDAVLTEFVVGNSPSRPYFFWYSSSPRNVWGYKNDKLDQAFDGLRRAATEADYREAFRNFQLETINDPPAIFLALGEVTRAVSKRFDVVAPPGTDILPTIFDWRPGDQILRTAN